MVLHGELVGAIELSDAGDRGFSRHAEALDGLACICAESVAVKRTYGELAHRDKTVRELVDLSARWRRPTTSSASCCASRSGS